MEHLVGRKLCNKSSKNGQLAETQRQKPFVKCLSPLRNRTHITSRSLTGCTLPENRRNSRTSTPDSCSKREEIESKTNYDTRKVHSQPLTSILLTKSLDCGPRNFYPHKPKIPLIKYRLNLDWEQTATISKGSRMKNNKVSCRATGKFSRQKKQFFRGPNNIKPFFRNSAKNAPGMEMAALREKSNEFLPWQRCRRQTGTKGLGFVSEGDISKDSSKLKPLQRLRPAELTIRGSVLQLSKRKEFQHGFEDDSCRSILLDEESLDRNGRSVYITTEMQWADAFAKPTVRRLNEMVLSLAKQRIDGLKLHSKRVNCSTCCFTHVQ